MKATHTKGPFIVTDEGSQIVIQTFSEHPTGTIARMYGTDALAMADARLMAAAPELLAILEKIISTEEENIPHGIYGINSFNVAAARAAIAKATGADIPKGKTLCEIFSQK